MTLTTALSSRPQFGVIDLGVLLALRQLIEVEEVKEFESLLQRGATHDAKQLTETVKAHLSRTSTVHELYYCVCVCVCCVRACV